MENLCNIFSSSELFGWLKDKIWKKKFVSFFVNFFFENFFEFLFGERKGNMTNNFFAKVSEKNSKIWKSETPKKNPVDSNPWSRMKKWNIKIFWSEKKLENFFNQNSNKKKNKSDFPQPNLGHIQ